MSLFIFEMEKGKSILFNSISEKNEIEVKMKNNKVSLSLNQTKQLIEFLTDQIKDK
jgi:hypothetical protein